MLFSALDNILEDDSFRTSSSVAASARQTATLLFEWCSEAQNETAVVEFMKYITKSLGEAVQSSSAKRFNKEKMWQRYFTVRSSQEFIQQWKGFISQAGLPATPVLFQHLTDLLFRSLVKQTYQVNKNHSSDDVAMTNDETNVLRYVAGYVCRHLRKKIERSKHPLKEELVLCLMSLVKDDSGEVDDVGTAEEWTNIINRGGLWHVKSTTYSFFWL